MYLVVDNNYHCKVGFEVKVIHFFGLIRLDLLQKLNIDDHHYKPNDTPISLDISREEHIDNDDEHLPHMQEQFPVKGMVRQSYVEEPIRCLEDLVIESLPVPKQYHESYQWEAH